MLERSWLNYDRVFEFCAKVFYTFEEIICFPCDFNTPKKDQFANLKIKTNMKFSVWTWTKINFSRFNIAKKPDFNLRLRKKKEIVSFSDNYQPLSLLKYFDCMLVLESIIFWIMEDVKKSKQNIKLVRVQNSLVSKTCFENMYHLF